MEHFGERLKKQSGQRFSAPKCSTQVNLVIAEQARAQPAVRGETHAIAATAIRMRHGCDHADASGSTRE